MGGELFVMDDGWFGKKYPRKTDNCALGDWVVDTEKLPDVIDNKPLDCEGKSYSGKYLMEHGLEMPYTNEVDWGKKTDWSSRVLYLEAQ